MRGAESRPSRVQHPSASSNTKWASCACACACACVCMCGNAHVHIRRKRRPHMGSTLHLKLEEEEEEATPPRLLSLRIICISSLLTGEGGPLLHMPCKLLMLTVGLPFDRVPFEMPAFSFSEVSLARLHACSILYKECKLCKLQPYNLGCWCEGPTWFSLPGEMLLRLPLLADFSFGDWTAYIFSLCFCSVGISHCVSPVSVL